MEHIAAHLPKAIEAVARQMKACPLSIEASESFNRNFQTLNDPQLENMRDISLQFASDMLGGGSPRWLSLLGNSGAGKTLIARIVYRLYRWKFDGEINWTRSRLHGSHLYRFRCGFMNWGTVVNQRMLKGDFRFLEDLRDYDFFAIDDIVAEHEKHRELSASKLYDVLEARLGKWTVITANLSLDQIGERLDPRISSRMLRGGSDVVDVEVPDFNLRSV